MTEGNNRRTSENKVKTLSMVLKLLIFVVILVGIPLYIYFFHHDLISEFSSLSKIEEFLAEHRTHSIIFYLIAQVLQIIVSVIPGQELQFAAGYVFGFWPGLLYSLIGAVIGTTITFYLAQLLGRDSMTLILGKDRAEDLISKISSKKGFIIIFLLYLIPGLPKDICSYAAGISKIKFLPFIIASTVGRTPGMIGSLLIGRQVGAGGYTSAIIIGCVALIVFVICIIFRKKINEKLDTLYDRVVE